MEPDNDAGNGERLILFGRAIKDGISAKMVAEISATLKTIIAVPNYHSASEWSDLAKPPKLENFSAELDTFRKANSGVFLLVSRVDGIDLPHDTCRVMVLDGLPSGTSLLERYQWEFLRMSNVHATRLANRLVQLFGRINRGRNDYGVFLVSGSELNAWLNKDRNVALLPQLLQRQITLGRTVQDDMSIKTQEALMEAINAVISREPSWLEFYGDNIKRDDLDQEQVLRVQEAEPRKVSAAQAEAEYAAAMWNGDYAQARSVLDETIENTGRADALLAGWQSVWLGAAFEHEGDRDSARLNYRRAISRLGNMIVLPRGDGGVDAAVLGDDASAFARGIDRLVGLTSSDRFKKELTRIRSQLKDLDGASPRRMEESVRVVGELLGFAASRPDNDVGTGPDVLWTDEAARKCLALELKTDKSNPATYWKRDISDGHDHLAWVATNKDDCECLGLLFVGPDGARHPKANPSDAMWRSDPSSLAKLRDQLLALIADLRSALPLQRPGKTREACDDGSWEIGVLFERLKDKRMRDMIISAP